MEIDYDFTNLSFSQIFAGEMFVYERSIYIKTSDKHHNALDIYNGDLHLLADDLAVMCIDDKFIIEGGFICEG